MLRRPQIKSPNSRWASIEEHEQQARKLEELAYAHRQSANRKRKKKKRRSNILFLLLGVTITLFFSRFFYGEKPNSSNSELALVKISEDYTLLQVKYSKVPQDNPDSLVLELRDSGLKQYLVKSEGPQNWLLTEITQNQQGSIKGTSFTFPLPDEVLKAQAPRYALYKTGELILLNIPATQDTQGILVAVRRKVKVITEK